MAVVPAMDQARRSPMFVQFFLAFGILVLVLGIVSTTWFYFRERTSLLAGIDQKLFAVATMARELLPADYHDRIRGADSVADAEYQSIVQRFNQLCVALGLEYIWSLSAIDGEIRFTTATSPDKVAANRKHAAFFELHSNPELYWPTFGRMEPVYQINDDKWGRIRVVLLPFRDASGRPYLFGASERLSTVDAQLSSLLLLCVLVGLVLLVCGLLLAWFLARSIALPLRRLADVIRGIAAGKSDLVAAIEGSREQADLALSFNRMNEAIKEARALAEEEERLIRTSLGENEALLKEVHHRVKNNLTVISSLLGLQASGIGSPEQAISAFENSRNRILAMALVHEELYKSGSFARVDMSEYLGNLTMQILDTYGRGRNISLSCGAEGVGMGVDAAIPCGLILNELITNAYKHAFPTDSPGRIDVSISMEDGGRIVIEVRDDGVGLRPEPADAKGGSLGLSLVRLLVDQLGGGMDVSLAGGTSYRIVFPGR